jgi:hypothetical protein
MAASIVKHLRTHAIAYVAVFLALGAGSVATAKKSGSKKVKIAPNSIGTGKLKDNAVKEKKIKDKAVTRAKLDTKIPVAEAVGNVVYTTDAPSVPPSTSGIVSATEATGGADGFVCVDTTAKVATAVSNAADANKFVSITIPAGATCPAAADALVTITDDTGAHVKGSFSFLAF